MTTAIVFYSFSGKTKACAQKMAQERTADVFQVEEAKKRNGFTAFLPGCPQAMGQKSTALKGEPLQLDSYDTIIIAAPIWAGYPAPAFNSIVKMLPTNKNIELVFTSGNGNNYGQKPRIKTLVETSGSKVTKITDIKT
jgi:flavodoxin